MIMYTVFMINFGLNKGSFNTLEEAIAHAKALGFECSIVAKVANNEHILTVKPY